MFIRSFVSTVHLWLVKLVCIEAVMVSMLAKQRNRNMGCQYITIPISDLSIDSFVNSQWSCTRGL